MMRVSILHVLLVLVLFSGCTSSDKDVAKLGPLNRGIFLRGTMNNWDTSLPFAFADNRYVAVAKLTPGTYSFKIGDERWEKIILGADPAHPVLLLSTPLPLVANGGDLSFSAPAEGHYAVMLNVNEAGSGTLEIHRVVSIQENAPPSP